MEMKGLHIKISPEQHERLKLISRYYGMSMKAYVLTFINTAEAIEMARKIKEKKI